MKLSVRIITYNHAPFIRQAIESVLMQQTNFDFEILIGEDASTDGTREIVREYEAKYPTKIRALYNERKDVIYVNGRPTACFNFLNTLKNCRGEYVALLDGDDYWSSPQKLQKQVDFLDKNPQCSVCCHDVVIEYENETARQPYPIKVRQPIYTLEEFLDGSILPPTGSIMLRNGLVQKFPEWFFKIGFVDLPLLVLHGEHGDIGFIDEPLSVYRKHRGGIWSEGAEHTEWSNEMAIKRFSSLLAYNETIQRYLPAKYHRVLRKRISGLNYELVWLYQCQKNWPKMREHLRRAFRAKALHPQFSSGFVMKSSLVGFFPVVYRFYQRLKKNRRGSPDLAANKNN